MWLRFQTPCSPDFYLRIIPVPATLVDYVMSGLTRKTTQVETLARTEWMESIVAMEDA